AREELQGRRIGGLLGLDEQNLGLLLRGPWLQLPRRRSELGAGTAPPPLVVLGPRNRRWPDQDDSWADLYNSYGKYSYYNNESRRLAVPSGTTLKSAMRDAKVGSRQPNAKTSHNLAAHSMRWRRSRRWSRRPARL